jgi:ribonuclease Z
MKYTLFSKGLHATWILSHEFNCLFDCGEGCSTLLGYRIFVPDRLFISHGHIDHVAGLPAFLGLRNSTKGANDKPLTIYYPEGNRRIEEWLNFAQRSAGRLKYPLVIKALKPGERVSLNVKEGAREQRFVEAFPVQHCADPCYGYRIISISKKLKPEFQGKPPEFYRTLDPKAKADMYADTLTNKFFFSGDAMPLRSGPDSPLNQAEVAFLDATFLTAADRENPTHASIEEVAQKCEVAGVKEAYAIHVSIRYYPNELAAKLAEVQAIFPLKFVPNDRVVEIV